MDADADVAVLQERDGGADVDMVADSAEIGACIVVVADPGGLAGTDGCDRCAGDGEGEGVDAGMGTDAGEGAGEEEGLGSDEEVVET